MARSKLEKIPAGDEYLPDVPEAELESMIAAIPSCTKIPRAAHIDGCPQKEEARKHQRYSQGDGPAVHHRLRLAAAHTRARAGWQSGQDISNRKKILDEDACRLIL